MLPAETLNTVVRPHRQMMEEDLALQLTMLATRRTGTRAREGHVESNPDTCSDFEFYKQHTNINELLYSQKFYLIMSATKKDAQTSSYSKRLKDNVKSILENYGEILRTSKVSQSAK